MKQHRNEFDGSEAQKTLVAWHMQEGGLKPWQAEKCRDNWFTAMFFDRYGGRKALKEVIRTGRFVKIRLGQTRRSLVIRPSKFNEIPPLRPRYIDNKERTAKEKKSEIRAKYYGNMAIELRETDASTDVWQAPMCRRITRIMMHRQQKFLTGQPSDNTTCKWQQYHLRNAGVDLPPVEWRKKGHNVSRSWRY